MSFHRTRGFDLVTRGFELTILNFNSCFQFVTRLLPYQRNNFNYIFLINIQFFITFYFWVLISSLKKNPVIVFRSSRPEVFCKNGEACNFIKKETLAQVFSCKFCEFSKNTFFYRTPPVAAFESWSLFFKFNYHSVIAWYTSSVHIEYFYNFKNSYFFRIIASWKDRISMECNSFFLSFQKQPPELFHKKVVAKNFATFPGKYLRWGLFLMTLL